MPAQVCSVSKVNVYISACVYLQSCSHFLCRLGYPALCRDQRSGRASMQDRGHNTCIYNIEVIIYVYIYIHTYIQDTKGDVYMARCAVRFTWVKLPCSSSTLSPSNPNKILRRCARFFSRQNTMVRVWKVLPSNVVSILCVQSMYVSRHKK